MAGSGYGCQEFVFQRRNESNQLAAANPGLTNQYSRGNTTTNLKNQFERVPAILGIYYESNTSATECGISDLTWVDSPPNVLSINDWTCQSLNPLGVPSFDTNGAPSSGVIQTFRYKYLWEWRPANPSLSWVNKINIGWKYTETISSNLPTGSIGGDVWHIDVDVDNNTNQTPRCMLLFLGVQSMASGAFDGSIGDFDSAVMPLSILQTT